MPNRILKESITTSDTIDRLSAEEERLFYRLVVKCDDYGRFDARPLVILGQCFPLKIGKISEKQIQQWLCKLQDVGLLRLYVVGGRVYLQMTTFAKHQQVRASKSKYPAPPEEASNQLISIDSNGSRPTADSPYSESESESESDSSQPAAPLPSPVQEVWEYYRTHIQPRATVCPESQIRARLKRFSVDQLKTAVDRFKANHWWYSHNKNQGGKWFFESDSQVDRFLLLEPETQEESEARNHRSGRKAEDTSNRYQYA